jgi:DNA polymerase II small subunit
MDEQILKLIREKGLLLEKDIFDLVEEIGKPEIVKEILVDVEKASGQKMITKDVLEKNLEVVKKAVSGVEGEDKRFVENVFVKLGVSLEIWREREVVDKVDGSSFEDATGKKAEGAGQNFRVFYADTKPEKKLEVRDFVDHFRVRYQEMQKMLMGRSELQNLVSINKISSDRASLSIIGIVTEKRFTKNKNLILRFEDLTGEISGIVKCDNEEVFSKAREVLLDDIIGVRASGSREMLFVHDLFFPDSFVHEKTRFEEDVCVAFLSDVHCGSDKHLGKSFEKFLEWIGGDDETAKKIKYLFFVGDNVDGVGIFPGQERLLNLKTMEEQYGMLASYLKRIPKNIEMFMCAGQHDAVRVAEPQPLISKKYAPQLYEIENLTLVTNPSMVKLLEGNKEFKILMYHGAGFHENFVNEIQELREMDVYKSPAKIVRHVLKRRHLSPTHSAGVYIPNKEKDPLIIREVPDVLCTGEVHHLDIENYNGVLILTGSCWQGRTEFEEKVGHIPDPCKVPVLNLKTREIKVYDFSDTEEIEK